MRRVIWSDRARADYITVLRHISADDPDAAERVLMAIQKTGDDLGVFATGHPGRVVGTYEKSVRGLPYILAYALIADDEAIAILRVIHAARNWQEDEWPT